MSKGSKMGIYKLFQYLKKYCGYDKKMRKISINDMKGRWVAIDIQVYLYKFKWYIVSTKGDNNCNIEHKFVEMISMLLQKEILPIIIMDGIMSPLKKGEVMARSEIKKKTKNKYLAYKEQLEAVGDDFDESNASHNQLKLNYIKLKKRYEASNVTQQDRDSIVRLSRLLKLPTFVCDEHEAELCCSKLNQLGCADYIATTDTDALFTGDGYIDLKTYPGEFDYVKKSDIMEKMCINNNKQFQHYCLMFKTDIMSGLSMPSRNHVRIHDDDFGQSKLIQVHGYDAYINAIRFFNPVVSDFKGLDKFYDVLRQLRSKFSVKEINSHISKIADYDQILKIHNDLRMKVVLERVKNV